MKYRFKDVVLIADKFEKEDNDVNVHLRDDLEMTDESTIHELCQAITELGLNVHYYTSPAILAQNASMHTDDIILSIFGGKSSRNRMALVPAICESFGLKFIGPDVYGRIAAQDKEVSKRLAKDCNLHTPPWRLVRDLNSVKYAANLKFPVVVKPLMEGSSIGISQKNKVYTPSDMMELVNELIGRFKQPILIEEFVPGREVAYCHIQNAGNEAWSYSEIYIEDAPDFFVHNLFDAKEKQYATKGRTVRNIDVELTSTDKQVLDDFLLTFGNYGYCRVDGRLRDGVFHFLEFTPDAWIDPRGQFARGFTEKGWKYTDVIAAVLSSSF